MTDLVAARHAVPADVAVTAGLVAAAAETARPERGGRLLLDHDNVDQPGASARHQAAVSRADATLVVGTIDDVVVGYGHAYLSATATSQLCMIDELVVHPEARAIGVGSAVLAEIREWAMAQGCEAIESHVLPGNRAAKNFFERVGMKTRKMRVSADLS